MNIKPAARIIGDTAFGGVVGAATAIADTVVEASTGRCRLGTLRAMFRPSPPSAELSGTTIALADLSRDEPSDKFLNFPINPILTIGVFTPSCDGKFYRQAIGSPLHGSSKVPVARDLLGKTPSGTWPRMRFMPWETMISEMNAEKALVALACCAQILAGHNDLDATARTPLRFQSDCILNDYAGDVCSRERDRRTSRLYARGLRGPIRTLWSECRCGEYPSWQDLPRCAMSWQICLRPMPRLWNQTLPIRFAPLP